MKPPLYVRVKSHESSIFTTTAVFADFGAMLAVWATLQALSYVGEPLAILVTASEGSIFAQLPSRQTARGDANTAAAILVYLVAAVGVDQKLSPVVMASCFKPGAETGGRNQIDKNLSFVRNVICHLSFVIRQVTNNK